MLQLFADGQPLDTAGVKFNITLKNPLFQNKMEGSYVYNLKLPFTDRNKKIINYAHRLDSFNSIPTPKIQCLFNGQNLFEGPYIYTGGKGEISGHVALDMGNFLYYSQKKYLDEIDYGSKSFVDIAAALTYFNSIVDKFYPEVDFVLPMIQGHITDSFLPAGTTGYFEKDNINHWDNIGSSYTVDSSGDKGIISPQLFLQLVLKKIFQSTGYSFNDLFFATDNEFSKLILFNIFNANNGIPDIDGRPGYDSSVLNLQYNQHVPHTLISDLISGLQNLLNVRFFFNHINKQATAKDALDILSATDYIDITEKVISGHELELQQNRGFNLKQNPDNTDEKYKLFVEQESNYEKMYGGTVDTIADLPVKYMGYNRYYVIAEEEFYLWNPVSETWSVGSSPFHTFFFVPEKEYTIESSISSLAIAGGLAGNEFGNAAIDYRDISSRLLFYKGLRNNYPAGSANFNGKTLTHDLGILYKTRWLRYIDFILNSKIIKFQVMLSAKDVSHFDFSKKYRIDGFNYLVKEIKVPITESAILPAKFECYKV